MIQRDAARGRVPTPILTAVQDTSLDKGVVLDRLARAASADAELAAIKQEQELSPGRQLAAVQKEAKRRASKPVVLPRDAINVPVPNGLAERAGRLADVEGMSVEAFIIRSLEDVVGAMEAAHAEIDAADVQPVSPTEGMTNAEKLKHYERETAKRMLEWLSTPRDRPVPEKTPKPMSVAETNRRFMEAIGALQTSQK